MSRTRTLAEQARIRRKRRFERLAIGGGLSLFLFLIVDFQTPAGITLSILGALVLEFQFDQWRITDRLSATLTRMVLVPVLVIICGPVALSYSRVTQAVPSDVGLPILLIVFWGSLGLLADRLLIRHFPKAAEGSLGKAVLAAVSVGLLGFGSIFGAVARVSTPKTVKVQTYCEGSNGGRALPGANASTITVTFDNDEETTQTVPVPADGESSFTGPTYWYKMKFGYYMPRANQVLSDTLITIPSSNYEEIIRRVVSMGELAHSEDRAFEMHPAFCSDLAAAEDGQ